MKRQDTAFTQEAMKPHEKRGSTLILSIPITPSITEKDFQASMLLPAGEQVFLYASQPPTFLTLSNERIQRNVTQANSTRNELA